MSADVQGGTCGAESDLEGLSAVECERCRERGSSICVAMGGWDGNESFLR